LSWCYSGNPATSDIDAVRFLSGDTDSSQPWTLQDEEIAYCLTMTSNVYLAAAFTLDSAMAKMGGLATSKSVGDLSISWSDRYQQFSAKAQSLRTRATVLGVPTFATGLFRSEKRAADQDPDRIMPAHRIDSMGKPSQTPVDPSTEESS